MSEWERCSRCGKLVISHLGTIYVRRVVHGLERTVPICLACHQVDHPGQTPHYVTLTA